VHYEVDLGKLTASDLAWEPRTKTLTVTLPPVELSGPEYDLPATREYESGVLLLTLTDVERRLDAENRAKAQADIMAQAKAAPVMKLAREATIRAISASFAMPLSAAGVDAKVVAKY
jgi:hypothetical protein